MNRKSNVSKSVQLMKTDRRLAWQLVTPGILGIGLVIIFPLAYALYISFHDFILSHGEIGKINLSNYLNIFQDKLLINASRNTLILAFSVVSIELLIGFGLALLLNNKRLIEKNVYLVILLIPMLMPPIAVGLIWRLLLHPELGIVNYLLGELGLAQPLWFADAKLAMLTVILVDVWHETSFIMLILLSGLTSLPGDLYEAATMDGANGWQQLRFITVPLLKPAILIATLIRLINALQTYDLIYILTRGGPGISTETVSYYIYRVAFVYLDMGKSSAMSFTLLIVIVLMTIVLMRVMRPSET